MAKVTIETINADVKDHFNMLSVKLPEDFTMTQVADAIGHAEPILLGIMFCNLEDRTVMQEIAEGNYSNYSSTNRNIFNDGYADLMNQMCSI